MGEPSGTQTRKKAQSEPTDRPAGSQVFCPSELYSLTLPFPHPCRLSVYLITLLCQDF